MYSVQVLTKGGTKCAFSENFRGYTYVEVPLAHSTNIGAASRKHTYTQEHKLDLIDEFFQIAELHDRHSKEVQVLNEPFFSGMPKSQGIQWNGKTRKEDIMY